MEQKHFSNTVTVITCGHQEMTLYCAEMEEGEKAMAPLYSA